MKHLFLATLVVVLSVNSSHAQISTILTRLTAQRALTNTNITTKTGSRSITPLNVGYSDDSIMAIMYSLAGLTGAAGDLDAVLTLGNISDLDVDILKNGVEGEFHTKHMYNGCQTIHNPSGGGSEYPVTFMGRVAGNNVLYLRDAFGYFGYVGAGALTADRKVLLPDEGDGVGLDATLVTHTTEDALTVSSTSTAVYGSASAHLSDNSSNGVDITPSSVTVMDTSGTTINQMAWASDNISYAYTNSIGSVVHVASLVFSRPTFTGVTTQSLYFPSATNDTLAVKGDITSFGNFATADLTFTGTRAHHLDRYGVSFDSALMWKIRDTNNIYLLNLNDPASYSASMAYIGNVDKIVRISPNVGTGFQSRLYFSNSVAGTNICQLFSGSNQLSMSQSSGVCNVTINTGNGVQFIVDSLTKSVNLTHMGGLTPAPTIAAGTGAGTSPTVSVGSGSTDLSGYVNITTGTTCATDATVATITFNAAYATAPKCIILTPANKITQNLTKGKECFVDQSGITTTTFTITSNTTALTDATAYKWYYTVIQ